MYFADHRSTLMMEWKRRGSDEPKKIDWVNRQEGEQLRVGACVADDVATLILPVMELLTGHKFYMVQPTRKEVTTWARDDFKKP